MKVKVWTALLAVYIVWGSTYLAIRFAVETIPPFLMAGTALLDRRPDLICLAPVGRGSQPHSAPVAFGGYCGLAASVGRQWPGQLGGTDM